MAPIRRRLVSFALGFALLGLGVPATAGATIQLGVYTPGAPVDATALAEYSAMVGRQPDIVMWYRDFGLPLMYSSEVTNLRATGQTPMVTWEPNGQSLTAIASGTYDSYLHESAAVAKEWGAPLMIRFAHEMNAPWTAWSGSPEAFIAAWRHVVSVFRGDGVTNVKWVWAPNIQEGSQYQIAPYFPGDEWIDYVGLDGYNWGSSAGTWQSLREVFAPSYAVVTQLSSKPLIITETASSETGGDKAAWIREGFMSTIPREFPRVSGVVWFNTNKEQDWRINSSSASLEAYRAVANCSLYGGTGPCEGASSEPPTESPRRKRHKKLTLRSVRVTQQVLPAVTGSISYGITDSAQVKIEIVPRAHPRARFKVTRQSHRGHNRVSLQRLVRRHRLRSGSYRVVVRARAGNGDRSRPHKAGFHVVSTR